MLGNTKVLILKNGLICPECQQELNTYYLNSIMNISDLIYELSEDYSDDFTEESLEKAIKIAMLTSYDSTIIRQDMITRFSPSVIAKKYISFYNRLMLD